MGSQWDCLLKNLGVWQGSFAHFSPQGLLQDETPSRVTLAGLNDNRTIQQTIQKFADGALIYDRVLEYSTLNRSILFFETGAFSQGSIQYGPFAEFGAEMGLIADRQRLRLVQQFDRQSQLDRLTLIREWLAAESLADLPDRFSAPSDDSQSLQQSAPDLTPEATLQSLVGTWVGEAETRYPDWRDPVRSPTQLTIAINQDQLRQTLRTPNLELSSVGQVAGSVIRFEQGSHPVQVVLLPGGGSSNTPVTIPRRQPFFLEAGWLIAPDRRQRLIRSYDDRGEWVSLTLVTEKKI